MREHCLKLTARTCVYKSHMSGNILECHKLQRQAKASGAKGRQDQDSILDDPPRSLL